MRTRSTRPPRRRTRVAGVTGRRWALAVCGSALALCGALAWLDDGDPSGGDPPGSALVVDPEPRPVRGGGGTGLARAAWSTPGPAVAGGDVVPLAAARHRGDEPLLDAAPLPDLPRDGTEAHYRVRFQQLLEEHGPATYAEVTGAVLAGPFPDCARVAALAVAEENAVDATADLLGQALVAPADEPRGRASVADWAARRLDARAADDHDARDVLAAVASGRLPTDDAALRRRAATSLARHGSTEELERLFTQTDPGSDPLLAASLRPVLAGRDDGARLLAWLPPGPVATRSTETEP